MSWASVSSEAGFCRTLTAGSRIAEIPAVRPLFDLSLPERSPFPSDRFTVADDEQNTAWRLGLRLPANCTIEASECENVAILNQLEWVGLLARISVSFDARWIPRGLRAAWSSC
jgi:hypothetical protein